MTQRLSNIFKKGWRVQINLEPNAKRLFVVIMMTMAFVAKAIPALAAEETAAERALRIQAERAIHAVRFQQNMESLTPELRSFVQELQKAVQADVAAGTCTPGPTTLCALGGKYRIDVNWSIGKDPGQMGAGQAIPITLLDGKAVNGGNFWFFDETNPEMLAKMVDGCALGGHYWVFFSATTNVAFWIQFTDIAGSDSRSWVNPLGNPAPPVQDTSAFSCPAPP
ncbi:MAG TPA: hypothetical protein VHR45_10055 [Thermoanaerobaculia bacterium]|nr:hypothetical protein [Thermoanaerobaculia bacterium]